jgi:hypothetical protein
MSSSTDDSISDKRGHKTHHTVSAPKKTPPAKK